MLPGTNAAFRKAISTSSPSRHSPTCRRYLGPILLLISICATLPAQAANILVETLDDSLVNDKDCSLREAIVNANNNDKSGSKDCTAGEAGLDAIVFEPGLGGGTIDLNEELPVISEALSITGPVPSDAGGVTLDAHDQFRVLHIEGSVPNEFAVSIEGMTFMRGHTDALDADGAGINVVNADLDLTDCSVIDNHTTGDQSSGAGIRIANGNIELTRCTVSDNSTAGDSSPGGGLFAVIGNVKLTDSSMSGNTTGGSTSRGGAIAASSGSIGVNNSTLSGNQTTGTDSAGGGLYTHNGIVTLLHATLAMNVSTGTAGDGESVHINNPADSFTLLNSLILQANPAQPSCSKEANIKNGSLSTHASCTGVATLLDDVELKPLAFYGGPTQVHALGLNSAAADSAAEDICNQQDQRGAPRETQCDIGAYEYLGFLEMGDAPTAAQSGFASDYPTLLIHDGASHVYVADGPILGALRDVDADGQPNADATGDDNFNQADEDGIFFSSELYRGRKASVDVTVGNGPAVLDAWMDFNADGDFDDADEQIFAGQTVADGSNPELEFAIPSSAALGDTFARFRISSAGNLEPRGLAADGEVEDYAISIDKRPGGGGGGGSSGCSLTTGSSPDPLLPLLALLSMIYLARKSSRRV